MMSVSPSSRYTQAEGLGVEPGSTEGGAHYQCGPENPIPLPSVVWWFAPRTKPHDRGAINDDQWTRRDSSSELLVRSQR